MPYQPRATFDNPYGPLVTFRTEDVLPPSAYYLDQSDELRIIYVADAAPFTFLFVLRFLTPQGTILIQRFEVPVTVNNAVQTTPPFPPMEGYILGGYLQALSPGIGQCFAIVDMVRGTGGATIEAGQTLMQGYVNQFSTLNYPPSRVSEVFSGPGTINTLALANPGQGHPFAFLVPLYTRWSVRSVIATLFTDATAGSRYPALAVYDQAGNILMQLVMANGIAANTQTTVVWAVGLAQTESAGVCAGPLPSPLVVAQGYQLGVAATSGPADTWINPFLSKEEWVGF